MTPARRKEFEANMWSFIPKKYKLETRLGDRLVKVLRAGKRDWVVLKDALESELRELATTRS